MFRTFIIGAVTMCAALATTSRTAPAAIITSFHLPSGPIIPVSTPAPNNDNTVVTSANTLDLPVAPGTALVFGNSNPISINFTTQTSVGTTEYFVRETVLNDSATAWTGFNLQLPTGNVNSAPVALFDSPSFDPRPTASAFGSSIRQPTTLSWSSGLVPVGGTLDLTFSIDAPDNLPTITSISLTQVPIAVPEPQNLELFAIGFMGLLVARRRGE